MLFQQIRSISTGAYSYLLGNRDHKTALVIDPITDNLDVLLALIGDQTLDLSFILLTHAYPDAESSATALRSRAGGSIVTSSACKMTAVDWHVDHDDHLAFGEDVIHVIATPGHTPCSVCYRWRDRLFTGDTLLAGDCGDVEQPKADASALFDSVTNRLFVLPPETLVFPGHDAVGRTVSTIAEEKAINPRFKGHSRDTFAMLMSETSPSSPTQPRMSTT
ncbi:MAG: MBL fold metallo-hydrolase [Sterolibacterium sp.]